MNQLIIPGLAIYVYQILYSNAEMRVKNKEPEVLVFCQNVGGETQKYTALDIHQILNN